MIPRANARGIIYRFYNSFCLFEKYLVKLLTVSPVAAKILAMLPVDGQRGWPYFDQRLLLLKIVGSRPLRRANPEQDILCALAKQSIAYHTSLCVICFFTFFVCCFVYIHNITPVGIFPAILFLYVTVYKSGYAAGGAEIWEKFTKMVKNGDFFLSKNFFDTTFVLRFWDKCL